MKGHVSTRALAVLLAAVLGWLTPGPAAAQQAKLLAPDPFGAVGDLFGSAVAVDGDTAVVGAFGESAGTGAAYVFTRSGGVWDAGVRLTGSSPGGRFGKSVAVSGDTVAVGAYCDSQTPPCAGAVYIFTRGGGAWSLEQKITPPDPALLLLFGDDVALDGDTLVVGARGDSTLGPFSGAAYVCARSGGLWRCDDDADSDNENKNKFLARAPQDSFGLAVAVNGGRLLVGAPHADAAGTSSGAAYAYAWDGSLWQFEAELVPAAGSPGAGFGYAVALAGDTALVGAPGIAWWVTEPAAAYVFTDQGASWSERLRLVAPDVAGGEFFGHAVAVGPGVAAVGALGDDDQGPDSGSVYVYTGGGADWTLRAKKTAADAAAGDLLGQEVALSGSTLVAGAERRDDKGADSGAAYVFTLDLTPPQPGNADAAVFVWASEARPGFDLQYTVVLSNLGDAAAQGVTAEMTLPAEVAYLSSSPPAGLVEVIGGRTRLTWNLSDLAPGETRELTVLTHLPAATPLGTPLESTAWVGTSPPDVPLSNNLYDHGVVAVGSFDPNDKGVTPQGFLTGDERLFYLVRFENEGTADAIDIRIHDVLSSLLDETTLVIGAGGSYDAATRTLTWELLGIHLPPEGTGSVWFSVRPVAELPAGTEIRNGASIVFDFNAPVETPDVVSVVGGEEELAIQGLVRDLASALLELGSLLRSQPVDPEPYFALLDPAVGACREAFRAVDGGESPWPALNDLQARLAELVERLQTLGSSELPEVLVEEWTARIEEEMLRAILALDTEPPEISVTASPAVLWPPNHRLVAVEVEVAVSDVADPAPRIELVAVESSEPDEGLGDGDRPGDVQGAVPGTDDTSLWLRAERSGLGGGRQYRLTYAAEDASGNRATAEAVVTVPHDRSE